MGKKRVCSVNQENVEQIIRIISEKQGGDFSGYSRPSLTRRIQRITDRDFNGDFSLTIKGVSKDKRYFDKFLKDLTVNVTDMFRDPTLFQAIRKNVLPELGRCVNINIWHAACSTGEEVYSMATLLHEANLLNKAKLTGSDLNTDVLSIARNGVYSTNDIAAYTKNHQLSGGLGTFSEYYTTNNRGMVVEEFLRSKTLFLRHNLVTDSTFGKFDLVMCRNVLIYFQKQLQSKVIRTLKDSLVSGGFLCLGSRESIIFTDDFSAFEEVDAKKKIYRKK